MDQAFVRTEKGWLPAFVKQDTLVVKEDAELLSEADARKSLVLLPGEEAVKVILSDGDFQAYDVLLRSGDKTPQSVHFGPLEVEPSRRGCLLWFLPRNH